MNRGEFSKFIKSLEAEELREELSNLYLKIEGVKKYYAMELGQDKDRKKIFDKAKKEITNLIYIRNKPRKRPRVQKIKTILKDVAKFSVFEHELADLYLYAAEQHMAYLLRRPSTTQASYNNCVDCFKKACTIIDQLKLHGDFKDRCQTLTLDSDVVYMLEDRIVSIYEAAFSD